MSCCPTPCPTCPRKYLPLPGDGPQPSRFLLISDFPGETENKTGRVQTGKGGEELCDTYMPLANLRRRDFRMTNVQQCFPGHGKSGNKACVGTCAPFHIPQEIERTRPEVIILAGGMATKLCSGIVIDAMHGRPQHTDKVGTVFGWRGWVVPMYNPALGLRDGKWMTYLLDDWAGLVGELDHPGDAPEKLLDYRIARTAHDVRCYVVTRGLQALVGVDTEDHGGVPYSVQVSHSPGTGRFIPAQCNGALNELDTWMQSSEAVFHFAGHDIEVLRRMGVRVGKYRDTLQEAFQLGNLPQGLKALVYRLFRTTMTSWEDTVRPASIRALIDWMTEALMISHLDLYGTKVKEYKTCVCGHGEKAHWTITHAAKCACSDYTPRREEVEVPGDPERLFNRLLNHTDVGSEYDPWERLDAFWHEDQKAAAHLESRIGRYPILGIGNCTEAQAVRYAVGDADWTAQVAVELERRRQDSRWQIAQGDEDQ